MPGTMLKSLAGWIPVCIALCVLAPDGVRAAKPAPHHPDGTSNQVLEWNQVFIDTLIATNTANSSSQRLGAIVHTAVFDAANGIEQPSQPAFLPHSAPARH